MAKSAHRMFFALWPEESTREDLTELIGRLSAKTTGHWSRPNNLHITLAFLGLVETESLERLALVANTVKPQSLKLQLDRIEHWPKPKIICLTPTGQQPILGQLANELTTLLGSAGFELEKRPFRAHLTLARKAFEAPAESLLRRAVHWESSGFALVESFPHPEGSIYKPIMSWPVR